MVQQPRRKTQVSKDTARLLEVKARELYLANPKLTCQEIATALDLSVSAVSNYIRHMPGYEPKGRKKR